LSVFIYLFTNPYTVITNNWKGYEIVIAARFETGRIADVVVVVVVVNRAD